jgi:hypothetical protein
MTDRHDPQDLATGAKIMGLMGNYVLIIDLEVM